MNNEDEILFKEIKDRCRLSFELRGKMSLIQEKKYVANKSNFTLEHVKKLIANWINSRSEFTEIKQPIAFDMKKLWLNKSERELAFRDKGQEIIDSLSEVRPYEYLYVTHREDGMVVTVGKSSSDGIFLGGDLFYQLNTNRLSGTENIILRAQYGNERLAKYDELLRNYLVWAWIVPVESGKAKKLERLLGDELINQEVPILNYYSHRQ
ncbi:hypothetical protein [Enterococcus sp. DIV0660C]|uniref:hypothetical protein n=1 Tax=Enterococcus sp. DIV0660C TaxID=2230880 RepID=UPI001A8ED536|nr:hypothetical protein [Enterococcus sp. DIV0660C]MBO0431806.1 hypothetical protein [Enterococcus sp. DIV0660C]